MCRFLPDWVKRPFWAVVNFVRPNAVVTDERVHEARAQREGVEVQAKQSAVERVIAVHERERDEERIKNTIRAIEAELRSRGAR